MATRVVASHEMQKQLPELLLLVSKGDDIIIKKKQTFVRYIHPTYGLIDCQFEQTITLGIIIN